MLDLLLREPPPGGRWRGLLPAGSPSALRLQTPLRHPLRLSALASWPAQPSPSPLPEERSGTPQAQGTKGEARQSAEGLLAHLAAEQVVPVARSVRRVPPACV